MQWMFWIINLLVPATMLGAGLLYARAGEKHAGNASDQNEAARRAAHRFTGRLLAMAGGVLAAVSAALTAFLPGSPIALSLVLVAAQLVAFVCIVLLAGRRKYNG